MTRVFLDFLHHRSATIIMYLYLNVIVLKNNGKSHEIFQM